MLPYEYQHLVIISGNLPLSCQKRQMPSTVNGLQVNGGFDREFTKSLIIRDFDDVLKNPFRYVDLFLLHTLLSKKIPKIAMQDL